MTCKTIMCNTLIGFQIAYVGIVIAILVITLSITALADFGLLPIINHYKS